MFSWFKKKRQKRVEFEKTPVTLPDYHGLLEISKRLETRNAEMLMMIGGLQTENAIKDYLIKELASGMAAYLNDPTPERAERLLKIIESSKGEF